MSKKVLVLDIDGTLTNSKKEITPNTLKGILNIQEKGHIVVLASGRPTKGIEPIANQLKLDVYGGYILSFNGGRIINYKTKEVVYQKTVDRSYVSKFYKLALEHGLGMVTYDDEFVLTGTPIDNYMATEARINKMRIKSLDNFIDYIDFDVNKMLLTAEPEKAKTMEDFFVSVFGKELSIYRSEPYFIEVMAQNIDKAASLDVLLKSLGLTKKDAICCGDGFNDLSMIKYAGIGVAMANAQDAVKAAADYITFSNDKDGIVNVINRFILS